MVKAYKCSSCDSLFPLDEEFEPSYECGSCGETFVLSNSADGCSHRCPSCNKFASKLFDLTCPNCQDTEVDEVDAEEDEDGELIEVETETPPAPETSQPDQHVYKPDCRYCKGTGKVWLPQILETDPPEGRTVECVCWQKRDKRGRLLNP